MSCTVIVTVSIFSAIGFTYTGFELERKGRLKKFPYENSMEIS